MKLNVIKNNSLVLELELDSSKEYFIGRSPQSDIVLSEPEVSRKHARLFYKDGVWNCETLSDNAFLDTEAGAVKQLSLVNGSRWNIGGFELKYQEEGSKTFAIPSSMPHDNQIDDKTNFGPAPVKFVLFREDAQGEPIEEITLNDGPIFAGRSDECEILLHDEKASRKHFVLDKTSFGYRIKDLSSGAGILIDGQKTTECELKSGERIKIGNEVFLFQEIHSAFENLPALSEAAVSQQQNHIQANQYAHYDQPVVKIGGQKNKIKPIYFVLAFLLVAGIVNTLTEDKKSKKPQERQISSLEKSSPEVKLNENQKKFLEDTYNLALSLYTSGKYDLAALELNKIFQLVPNYKDAKNIEALCAQALELKKQKEEAERFSKEQIEFKDKVDGILAECEALFNLKKYSQVEACVSQIVDIDPDNQKAKWLVESSQLKIDQLKDTKAAQAAALRRAQQAKQTYDKALQALKAKRYPAAVREFTSVKQINFNDTTGLKAKSDEAIKFAKEQMRLSSQNFVNQGKSALEQKEYKSAISNLNKALELFNENKEAAQLKERALSELRLEMKNLYSESVIEEDLGNIESAKKKWRLILETNVQSDPYFQKAKNKINKYEK